jgi:putative ABC transport system substrate-binding protein
MQRRAFIALFSGAAVARPFAARSQQPVLPVIGFMSNSTAKGFEDLLAAFRQGLKEASYIEGQNVTIEYYWGEGHDERLPARG